MKQKVDSLKDTQAGNTVGTTNKMEDPSKWIHLETKCVYCKSCHLKPNNLWGTPWKIYSSQLENLEDMENFLDIHEWNQEYIKTDL